MVQGFAKLGIATYTYDMTMPRMPDLERARFDSGHFFDTVGKGVQPAVKGAYRLPNGWGFETYDRSRRKIADAIIRLQEALAQ